MPADYIRNGLKGVNGSVILLHCGPAITPKVLEAVIDGYVARGFGFVTLGQLFNVPGPVPYPTNAPPAPSPSPTPSPSGEPWPLRYSRITTVAY